MKRILGTAEDYRRLYGGGLLDPNASLSAQAAQAAAASVTPTAVAKTASTSKAPAKKTTSTPSRSSGTRKR